MNDIITKAFRALEEMVDVKIEPLIKKSTLLREQEEDQLEKENTEKTVRELFMEYGSYVFTHDFEFEGKIYSLFFEAINGEESADLLFDEFKIENVEDVLIQVLDEDRNFVAELEDLPSEKLQEADEDVVDPLDAKVDDVVAAAEEVITKEETPQTVEKLEEKPEEHKKEETLQLTGFNESSSKSEFFPGEEGDLPAGDFILSNNISDYRIEWDGEKQGYLVSWGNPTVTEEKSEGRHKLNKDSKLYSKIVSKRMAVKESQQFSLRDKDEMGQAKEVLTSNKEEESVEQIVDVNAETVDDLKKSYIGSTILQCPVCRTMIYKDPKDLVKPDGENVEGEKLYNLEENCPHCGAKDGFELVGQVASLDVNTDKKPEPPMVEPAEEQPAGDIPTEEPKKEEQPIEKIEAQPEEQPEEEQTSEDEIQLTALLSDEESEETEEDGKKEKKKKPKVSIIPEEEPVAESVEKKEIKETIMSEKYQDVILENLDEAKFDRLAKKFLQEVYDNIESYVTTKGKIDDSSNKIIIEGNLTFKSGKIKDTVFIFEAREITKKGKIKFVGINETFTKKKAFTLVGSVDSKNLLSESLTYSYKVDTKKVYGQVKNPTKV
jgi:hypothetical protein